MAASYVFACAKDPKEESSKTQKTIPFSSFETEDASFESLAASSFDTKKIDHDSSLKSELGGKEVDSGSQNELELSEGVKLVEAFRAYERGQYQKTIDLLVHLESEWPKLSEEIALLRASAQAEVGPYLAAAQWFSRYDGAEMQLRAARAFEAAGEHRRSILAAERVIVSNKHSFEQEAEARSFRLRRAQRVQAQLDATWIVVNAPYTFWAKEADRWLEAHSDSSLTQQEWILRAKLLGDHKMVDEAIRALDRASRARKKNISQLEFCQIRAEIFFKSHVKYIDSAMTYERCAALASNKERAEYLFFQAKALSLAEKDDEAIAVYLKVHRVFPQSRFGEQGLFAAAKLSLMHNKVNQASHLLDRYFDKYSRGIDIREAERYYAFAHYLNGERKIARTAFEHLAGRTDDLMASLQATNLAAKMAYEDGDTAFAQARYRDVIKTRPLSYAALVARQRLSDVHIFPGEWLGMDTNSSSSEASPFHVVLPEPVNTFATFSLFDEAEKALRVRENLITSQFRGNEIEALCQAYGMVHGGARQYELLTIFENTSEANKFFLFRPSAKTRWAWDCMYPTLYPDTIKKVSIETDVPAEMIYAVMQIESGYKDGVKSRDGAEGLMQITPEISGKMLAKEGHEWSERSREQNIFVGAKYLKVLYEEFKGSWPLAIMAYRDGPDKVKNLLKRLGDVNLDLFVELIPDVETRRHVAKVMSSWAHYMYLKYGEEMNGSLKMRLPMIDSK